MSIDFNVRARWCNRVTLGSIGNVQVEVSHTTILQTRAFPPPPITSPRLEPNDSQRIGIFNSNNDKGNDITPNQLSPMRLQVDINPFWQFEQKKMPEMFRSQFKQFRSRQDSGCTM